jgi:hypothetical protein
VVEKACSKKDPGRLPGRRADNVVPDEIPFVCQLEWKALMPRLKRSPSFGLLGCGRHILALAIVVTVTACASETLPDTATMPFGALNTNGDIDVRSLDVAAYDFAHRIKGDPAQAADAIAALDYMGGKLNTSPRWTIMPSLYRAQMLQAREIMRQFVGISPTAPAQGVVNTMLALAQAYRAQDQNEVQRLLASPIFDVPPAEVEARLNDIPVIPEVNNATQGADAHAFGFSSPMRIIN